MNELGSLCLWKPGHAPPTICFEVVSRNHPHKDYSEIQDRYALVARASSSSSIRSSPAQAVSAVPYCCKYGVAIVSECSSACTPATPQPRPRRSARGSFPRPPRSKSRTTAKVLGAGSIGRSGRARKRAQRNAPKERERAEKEREHAEKERERAARLELERRIAEIEAKVGGR